MRQTVFFPHRLPADNVVQDHYVSLGAGYAFAETEANGYFRVQPCRSFQGVLMRMVINNIQAESRLQRISMDIPSIGRLKAANSLFFLGTKVDRVRGPTYNAQPRKWTPSNN